MIGSRAAVAAYTWWLRRRLGPGALPTHVALVMDGNRRWAREHGLGNPSLGHQRGAEHVARVLGWCAGLGLRHVTVWVASADNLRKRDADEVAFLMRLVEDVVAARLARPGSGWRVHVTGQLHLLPDSTRHALKQAVEATRDESAYGDVTVAIGYSGRREIVDTVRALLLDAAATGAGMRELVSAVTERDIAERLDTAWQPAPDLVIRTSGEQRLSDFLLWQAAGAELFFCDVHWPAFREVDLLRALRSFARRRGAGRG